MSEQLNNPAARLYALLKEGQRKSGETRVAEVWANLLRVSQTDVPLLFRRLGKVISLPSQIRDEIVMIEDIDHDLYLRWSKKVEKAFKMLNLDARWKHFNDQIDTETLYGIEICSEVLSKHRSEQNLLETKVESILQKVDELIDDTRNSPLSQELKGYILTRLLSIKTALEEHHILGTHPVEKEIESIFGSIVINHNIYHDTKDTSIGKRFWEIVTYIAVVISIAHGSLQISKDVTLFLSPPEQVSESTDQEEKSTQLIEGPDSQESNKAMEPDT